MESGLPHSEKVQRRWHELCELIKIPQDAESKIWNIIEEKYCETGRYYHTLKHINSLLELSRQYSEIITNIVQVDLAIIFHDIIYNPQSGTNESDSAVLFENLLSPYVDKQLITAVSEYIILTKEHNVFSSSDKDLQLFIDFDMSILGADFDTYAEYSQNIRKEYIHVPESIYCEKRAEFLRGVFTKSDPIFATQEFKTLYEVRAKENMKWECGELEKYNHFEDKI